MRWFFGYVGINVGGGARMTHLAKDAAAIFVYKVEKQLFDLYQEMDGPHAQYVNETDFATRQPSLCTQCSMD